MKASFSLKMFSSDLMIDSSQSVGGEFGLHLKRVSFACASPISPACCMHSVHDVAARLDPAVTGLLHACGVPTCTP